MRTPTTRPRRALLLACSAGLLTTTVLAGIATPAAGSQPASTTAGRAAANQDNYSPTSRTLAPVAVQSTSGSVTNPTGVLSGGTTRLSGNGAQLVLDFGKEVGGITTVNFHGASAFSRALHLSFSETAQYIGPASDNSTTVDNDGYLTATVGGQGSYTVPTDQQRGGFRYLTLGLATDGWIDLDGVSLDFTAAPGVADPADYANYFHSNDETLNKIWYAGAYTVQLDTIDPLQGRAINPPSTGWENNGNVGPSSDVFGNPPTSVLTDGAKRDRTVWAGDLGIALPTEYDSTDDVTSGGNAVATLWQHQEASGELPYEGPPTDPASVQGSDTYHLWAMVGTADYYSYSGNLSWVNRIWPQYQKAMSFIMSRMDSSTGLINEAAGETGDWAATSHGTENIEVNALMYEALTTGGQLASAVGDSADAVTWRQQASALRTAVNTALWNPAIGLYRDTAGGGTYPQDGNSLAVWYGLTTSAAQNQQISQALTARWDQIGAVSPETGGLIGTFPGSMEVQAHFVAGDDVDALQLIRREWGYQLSNPNGPQSTTWEAYNYDGSSYYGSSEYASYAHGWATGPTSALTSYVLGLMPDGAGGQFTYLPHPGDLTHVEGTITMPQGKVTGVWDYSDTGNTITEQLTSPTGSTGEIGVPTYGSKTVSVTVNGATVWSNGAFQPTTGITGAGSDGSYVYLTGVAPGSYTVVGSGVHAPQTFATSVLPGQLPPGYTRCAAEDGTCTPTGTQVLAYGAGSYDYQVVSGPTSCSNATFGGDPAPNLLKSCYLAPLGGPAGFSQCASEGGTCTVNGTQEVAFGVNGAYRFLPAVGGVSCTDAAFGADPLLNVAKNCYVTSNGAPPGNWTRCSAEKSTCTVPGSQPVAIEIGRAHV